MHSLLTLTARCRASVPFVRSEAALAPRHGPRPNGDTATPTIRVGLTRWHPHPTLPTASARAPPAFAGYGGGLRRGPFGGARPEGAAAASAAGRGGQIFPVHVCVRGGADHQFCAVTVSGCAPRPAGVAPLIHSLVSRCRSRGPFLGRPSSSLRGACLPAWLLFLFVAPPSSPLPPPL